ncbi:unnamed protein product [Mycena citricolor]|uniref:laccase n=1 Tax=Mycena citricolor TaxID=2018698 RepID=A0AAD2HZ77_9AGAR|nr:unnamed protein product [Mycena citricolor]CAK5284941.1 unnamed protein product [Mycena citricolor]CAK5284949.1 unnamed protein product [Mycena citricolor]
MPLAMFSFRTLLSLTAAARMASGHIIGPVGYYLEVVNQTIAPDGVPRAAVLAGGTFPGPLITGDIGDNFQITVVDQQQDIRMLEPTSIHWHGLFQNGTSYMDGVAFVSQCPIAPGNSFTYDFTTQQAGTYWYHSHLATQYCDGLRGPIVLYDHEDPYLDEYDVDNEDTVITLADWYNVFAETVVGPGVPSSMLINGLGRTAATVSNTTLAVINVFQGLRYRFRLINMACDSNYVFQIDGHQNLTIIEADGVLHEPLSVDSIQIFAAQRYSFILTADQAIDNYWIRANPNTGPAGFAGGINSAILRYIGANESEPTTSQDTSVNGLVNEVNLHPLVNPGAPGGAFIGGADVQLNLALAFNTTTLKFMVNGVTFVPPTVPVLLQILSGAQAAQSLLPSGSVYTLPHFASVEITLAAGAVGGPHPFHLHGHVFDVIRPAGSTTYNYVNPARRDVVSIGSAGDNVTIRFFTDNRGPWFLHCHIDWHLEAGFAIVLAEDVPDWNSQLIPTSEWNQLCPIYDALPASITSLAA